ncbi:alpha/beta hydrolase [Sphaerisporangium corydalis]|uniref:Alpha/beta hydrolase n=1 Tax=Sphaerisporangium corydalis TaxID=1441875 RepID=A0ABV9E5X8_9ACTN|nr:alpha/beta hydrolase [Sphaerisporangium corydalis]
MAYAAGIAEFVDKVNAALPPDFYTYPVERQRALYDSLAEALPIPVPASVTWRDATVEHQDRPATRMRIYQPGWHGGDGVIFYVRGGGFVIGSLTSHHSLVAEIADRTGLVTVALDFGMAPENPFPGPVEDCYAGMTAVLADPAAFGLSVDPAAAVVAGESSGANMAVVLSMMARDRGGPALRGQALISPVLDFTRWRHGGEDAPLLSGGEMEFYTACYCPDPELAADPYVSPLLEGKFHDLPPAYVVGCEMDSLRVDAGTYADLLRANGTPVEHVLEAGMVHAPVRARGMSEPAADMVRRFCAAAAALAGGPEAVSDAR